VPENMDWVLGHLIAPMGRTEGRRGRYGSILIPALSGIEVVCRPCTIDICASEKLLIDLAIFIATEKYLDQRISLSNLLNSQVSPTLIVWRGHEGTEGWESGIWLINTVIGYWEVDL